MACLGKPQSHRSLDQELMGRIATRLELSDGPIWDLHRKDSIDEYLGCARADDCR